MDLELPSYSSIADPVATIPSKEDVVVVSDKKDKKSETTSSTGGGAAMAKKPKAEKKAKTVKIAETNSDDDYKTEKITIMDNAMPSYGDSTSATKKKSAFSF
mmetsp:Transcript_28136/g.34253  ORF Transcript_28136/g.34253 Transcript_28136/m.34253 type:complete len:102 (+) Transcript_28136:119-424(+)